MHWLEQCIIRQKEVAASSTWPDHHYAASCTYKRSAILISFEIFNSLFFQDLTWHITGISSWAIHLCVISAIQQTQVWYTTLWRYLHCSQSVFIGHKYKLQISHQPPETNTMLSWLSSYLITATNESCPICHLIQMQFANYYYYSPAN